MAADIKYDPQVLRTMAGVLYERAASIQLLYALLGIVLGLLAGGLALGTVLPHAGGPVAIGVVGGCSILGAVLGRAAAFMRVLMLRFQAQTALCQVEIEVHLRRLRQSGSAADPGGRTDNPW